MNRILYLNKVVLCKEYISKNEQDTINFATRLAANLKIEILLSYLVTWALGKQNLLKEY